MRTIGLLGMLGIVTMLALGCGDQVTVTSGVCSEATACTDGLVCCADNICRGVCSDADSGSLPPEDTGNKDAGKPKDVGDTGDLDVGADVPDAGADVPDAGTEDATSEDVPVTPDAGTDTGLTDQGYEDTPPSDVGNPDAGPVDAGTTDTGNTPDAGALCVGYPCLPGKHCEERLGQPSCVDGCLTDENCDTDYKEKCNNGVCEQTCYNYDCGPGNHCEVKQGKNTCVTGCVGGSNCQSGETCVNGKCEIPSCAKDADCWGDLPYCTTVGKCGKCNASTNCGTGKTCSVYMEPSQCVEANSGLCPPKTCAGYTDCLSIGGTCSVTTHTCVLGCSDASVCGGHDCVSGFCKCP